MNDESSAGATGSGRLIAIGDVHGCLDALLALIGAIDPRPEDKIVVLGDHVDRGPDSRGVIERLIALSKRCRLIPLMGNHEAMLLEILAGQRWLLDDWLSYGGAATLASYHCSDPEQIPPDHVDFLENCRMLYEAPEGFFFVHASYLPNEPLDIQPTHAMLWESIRNCLPGPHFSGKKAIVGHTSQKSGQILDLGYLKCIDTYCYGGKWLTALDVLSGRVWQADPRGRMK